MVVELARDDLVRALVDELGELGFQSTQPLVGPRSRLLDQRQSLDELAGMRSFPMGKCVSERAVWAP